MRSLQGVRLHSLKALASRNVSQLAPIVRRALQPQSGSAIGAGRRPGPLQSRFQRDFFSSSKEQKNKSRQTPVRTLVVATLVGGVLIYSLFPHDEAERPRRDSPAEAQDKPENKIRSDDGTAWFSFATRFEALTLATDIEWGTLSENLVGYILPEWAQNLPFQIRKLQHELSMVPGSLADEIWEEAHDPLINPEIRYSATVRVSDELCNEEKIFLSRRKKVIRAALAHYLELDERDVHPDDIPTIAMCGSGGGLRALIAGTGSLLASQQDGLFDCVTYTAGVSGATWLQAIYNSSLANCDFARVIQQLKSRVGTHIAYPPAALSSVTTAPTNKLLLSSIVEKLKGDTKADFGLVDVYGILLGARLLVPKGELGVNDHDFKLSNQQSYIRYGQSPLPIYTAVRHEIPESISSTEDAKEIAKQEAWFQWFEFSPYEVFCEEFSAGIPTWAIGRKFDGGQDVPPESGFHLPELRMPLLMGIFGSAFCATLSHYYRELRPIVQSLSGLSTIDEMIHGRDEDLIKVHPIDPAKIPNFVYGMHHDQLRFTTPTAVHKEEYIQLMDAGMSNNLPIYPLLRPGRDVDVIIAFDNSADTKSDNWLSVADGYARQRGIKGWPVGIGWPSATDSQEKVGQQLESAQAHTTGEASSKLKQAQRDQESSQAQEASNAKQSSAKGKKASAPVSDLSYCTVWVGTTEERSSEPIPPSKAITEDNSWQLMEPNAGITIVYLPLLANPRVPGVDASKTDYMSTWNFVWKPEQIDSCVALAQANFDEGKSQIRRCVKAVYERKKRIREQRESALRQEKYRRLVRLGINDKLGEGDHFS